MQTNQTAKDGFRAWIPTIGLAFAAFVFNTSEFLPVGLLPWIARSLSETVSHTGLMITGYAWVVALMSLPLTLWTARLERRRLLLCLLVLFALSHFAVYWTDSFASLFATRVGVALTHAVFWSIMTPLAARMAPHGKAALGLAAVMGGTISATVLGVPMGTKLGYLFGWHAAFLIVGLAAAAVLVLLFFYLPPCRSTHAGSLKSLSVIIRRPALLQVFALTMVTMLGQYTAYSYIAPILSQTASMTESEIVVVLFLFGIAGIIGTVLCSKLSERYRSGILIVPLMLISLCLLLLVSLSVSHLSLYVLVIVWGASLTAVIMSMQLQLLSAASDCADVATAIFSGIFNVGIGAGAFLGSQLSAVYGFVPLSYLGACFVLSSTLFCLAVYVKTGSAFLSNGSDGSRREPS